jgi:hypothetical protein
MLLALPHRAEPGTIGPATPPSAPSYSVTYTGGLYGYFRYPEVQQVPSPSGGECPAAMPGNDTGSPETYAPEAFAFRKFNDEFQKESPSNLLVAVGDNFAPFLLSRRVWTYSKPNKMDLLVSKEDVGIKQLQIDNVACFLRLAHFDAIVPGKYDFHFGPQRLRDLEGLLTATGTCTAEITTDCYQPVRILATNLSLKVQRTDGQQKNDGGQKQTRISRAEAFPQVSLPKVVLPWMRSIKVTYSGVIARIYICENHPSCPSSEQTQLSAAGLNDELTGNTVTTYRIPGQSPLKARTAYYILAQMEAAGEAAQLGSFTVAEPFFNIAFLPWITKTQSGQQIAIFGAVSQNFGAFVGRLNYTWAGLRRNATDQLDASYETIVNVTDPSEALNQALELCQEYPDCANSHKILLAQMPEAEVHQSLLPRLHLPDGGRFEIVITEANESAATPERKTELRGDLASFRPVVLVPGFSFKSKNPYKLKVRLHKAILTNDSDKRIVDNHVAQDDEKQVDPFDTCLKPLTPLTTQDCGGNHNKLEQAIIRHRELVANTVFQTNLPGQINNPGWRRGLEEITLRIMRESCHSDMAILQHRDIFLDSRLLDGNFTLAGINATVGALFWKGDFVQCLNISGQTVTSIMERSAELDRQEQSGEFTPLTAGSSLAVSGIEQANQTGAAGDQAKAPWLVNGQFLDPKKLYSIAVTDYIANGDTGFSELQNAEPPPQQTFQNTCVRRLTALVFAAITDSHRVPCEELASNLDKLDRSDQKPAKKHDDTFSNWALSWKDLNAFSDPPTGNKVEYQFYEEQKPYSFLRLYKLDFTYSLFQHNTNEGSIGAKFPGVTAADLSGVDSEAFTADYQVRWQHLWPRWEIYAESGANFGRRNQRNRNSPFAYQPSQTADVVYMEMGPTFRIMPGYQNPRGLKFILPVTTRTQLIRPYTQITPINAKPSNPVSAPRNYYAAIRPGFRFEHSFPKTDSSSGQAKTRGASSEPAQAAVQSSSSKNQGKSGAGGSQSGQSQSSTLDSYIEFGLETGRVFHNPNAFLFKNPGTNSVACPATGLVFVSNLLQCISLLGSGSQLSEVFANRNFNQNGLYLNFRIDAPLPVRSSAEYILENRGDFFFNSHSDTPVDTRYLDDIKHTLLFPIVGKLSVGPSIELILFKTKVSGNFYFSYATAGSLSYSFDWHSGLKRSKVLEYGSSDTPPNPLPTK